jgi:hypothetical protein
MNGKGSASFLKKRSKKTFIAVPGVTGKVFWFFFSKKNAFLFRRLLFSLGFFSDEQSANAWRNAGPGARGVAPPWTRERDWTT